MVCTVPHLILWHNLIDMNAPELVCVYKRKKKKENKFKKIKHKSICLL